MTVSILQCNVGEMYGKLFESMFERSMIGIGAVPISVWAYVIAKTKKSVVELHPVVMATVIGCGEDEIRAAIEVLSAPDPDSTNPDHEGRRLLKQGPFEYYVVSWERYNSIRNEEERRLYNREKQREHRAKVKKSTSVNDKSKASAMSAHSDVDLDVASEAEVRAPRRQRPTRRMPKDWVPDPKDSAHAISVGVDVRREEAKIRDHQFKDVVLDPAARWRTWLVNAEDYLDAKKPKRSEPDPQQPIVYSR